MYETLKPESDLKAIMFDLDGTLINSEKIFFESFKEALFKNYSVEISHKEYEENELKKNENLIIMLKQTGRLDSIIPKEEIMSIVYKNYKIKFKEILSDEDVVANFELIKKLKEKGLKCALVTTSRREFVDILLIELKLNDLFDVIITRESVEDLKPDPSAYIMALKVLNIDPKNCIAIEDSGRGIEAAMGSNIKTIQVTNYSMSKTEYPGATHVESVITLLTIVLLVSNKKGI